MMWISKDSWGTEENVREFRNSMYSRLPQFLCVSWQNVSSSISDRRPKKQKVSSIALATLFRISNRSWFVQFIWYRYVLFATVLPRGHMEQFHSALLPAIKARARNGPNPIEHVGLMTAAFPGGQFDRPGSPSCEPQCCIYVHRASWVDITQEAAWRPNWELSTELCQ